MVQREPVLRGAVESLGLEVGWRAIAGQVSARAVPRSSFLEISVVVLPYILVLYGVVLVCVLFPELILFLPNAIL